MRETIDEFVYDACAMSAFKSLAASLHVKMSLYFKVDKIRNRISGGKYRNK